MVQHYIKVEERFPWFIWKLFTWGHEIPTHPILIILNQFQTWILKNLLSFQNFASDLSYNLSSATHVLQLCVSKSKDMCIFSY